MIFANYTNTDITSEELKKAELAIVGGEVEVIAEVAVILRAIAEQKGIKPHEVAYHVYQAMKAADEAVETNNEKKTEGGEK